ncbi:AbrB/MazE/SpoVT family DNA-binding domain-containing protein [bacterium]|nr:AbrB/MazE/SpoVT family DNA-binding domain-containing protein [bacterium]MBU1753456.1 AbrB/MazE/SpoVT family DNA-binding domain-containing protein [bacterium]
MKTCIQEWDNGLALRIPESFAAKIRLGQGSEVEVSLVGEKLIVSPVTEVRFTLEHLLAGITEQNRHHEVNTGQSIGNEVW